MLQVDLIRIQRLSEEGIEISSSGTENKNVSIQFAGIDIIKEISANTSLAYPTVFKIVSGITNKKEIIKNPPRFLQEAVNKIKNIELDEMLRALDYKVTGEAFEIEQFDKYIIKNTDKIQPTPNKGIYDNIIWDSEHEQRFAQKADTDIEVVCFLKLPSFYVIKTPAGDYNPDFGIVLKKPKMREENSSEYYFVIEIKGTNDINDRKALTENEIYKIRCAIKHFEALGIEAKVNYLAPIKEYDTFKTKAEAAING